MHRTLWIPLKRDPSSTKSINKYSELLLLCRQKFIHSTYLAEMLLSTLYLVACETVVAGVFLLCFGVGWFPF